MAREQPKREVRFHSNRRVTPIGRLGSGPSHYAVPRRVPLSGEVTGVDVEKIYFSRVRRT